MEVKVHVQVIGQVQVPVIEPLHLAFQTTFLHAAVETPTAHSCNRHTTRLNHWNRISAPPDHWARYVGAYSARFLVLSRPTMMTVALQFPFLACSIQSNYGNRASNHMMKYNEGPTNIRDGAFACYCYCYCNFTFIAHHVADLVAAGAVGPPRDLCSRGGEGESKDGCRD